MEKQIKDFISKVEELGWSISGEYDEDSKTIEISKYTCMGEEFLVIVEGETFEELMNSVQQYYDNYDVDYETYLWLGSDGHGKCGAPYHIKDILKGKEDNDRELEKLSEYLSDYFQITDY